MMREKERPMTDLAEQWERHMRLGDFAAAWDISDRVLATRARLPCSDLPRHLQWVWRGESLVGRRVLIRCFHGLGDTIQFVRFIPRVREMAASITLEAQPELLKLLSAVRGVDRLVALCDSSPAVDRDVDVEVMELPHILRTTLSTLPRDIPYLDAPSPRRRTAEQLAVGLIWRAGDWDVRRSIPLDALAPLATLPNVKLYALQRGPALDEWPADWGPVCGSDDAFEAASIMRAMDLIVSVDSMPAHLAGALGIPVWTLLHAECDWRWMDAREDSPWYPTMRLFRQTSPGDWRSVVSSAVEHLAGQAA